MHLCGWKKKAHSICFPVEHSKTPERQADFGNSLPPYFVTDIVPGCLGSVLHCALPFPNTTSLPLISCWTPCWALGQYLNWCFPLWEGSCSFNSSCRSNSGILAPCKIHMHASFHQMPKIRHMVTCTHECWQSQTDFSLFQNRDLWPGLRDKK